MMPYHLLKKSWTKINSIGALFSNFSIMATENYKKYHLTKNSNYHTISHIIFLILPRSLEHTLNIHTRVGF